MSGGSGHLLTLGLNLGDHIHRLGECITPSYGVWGLEFGVSGVVCGAWGVGFGVWGLGCGV